MRFVIFFLLLSHQAAALFEDPPNLAAARQERARLEEILSVHPSDAFAHYQLGLVYREMGDNRKATVNLQAAIQGGFDNLGARLNLIEAAFASHQSFLALETAKQVIPASAKSPDVLLRVGKLLFDHLFYQESLRAFQLAQQASPNAFEPGFRLALTHYLLRDYASCIAALNQPELVPLPAEAISLIASAEAKLGQVETAASKLRNSIQQAPTKPHAYINLGLLELDRGNWREAETILDRFRALNTHADAKVFYSAGRNSCGEVAEALTRKEVAAHVTGGKAEFYYQLAVQLQEHFNFLSAVQLIRLAQQSEGSSARVLLVAGTSCLNHDPTAPEPITLLRAAIAQDASLDKAYYLLGRAYSRQGKPADALVAYQTAAELHPDPSYFVSVGKALEHRQGAIAAFERALSLDASYAQAYLELGREYIQLEKNDKAKLNLEKAIELEPDYYEAYYLLGRLLHQLGDEQKSHTLLTQFTEKKNALMQQSAISAGYVGNGN